jgi:hypothetical protein
MGFNWTSESIETLRVLAAKAMSARAIGLAIGTTKGSVIGKALRAGIKLECKINRPNGLPKAQPVFRKPKPSRPLPVEWTEPPSRNLTLLELRKKDCRFIVTADHPMLFCASERLDGYPYCGFHQAICTMRDRR